MSKQITTWQVKLIGGLMYRGIEKKILKSNLECIITNTFSDDIPLCNDVGLFVWAPNIIVHCITELCFFLRKFLGNSNAVGLGKKKKKKEEKKKRKAFCSYFSSQGLTLSLPCFAVSSSPVFAFKSGTTWRRLLKEVKVHSQMKTLKWVLFLNMLFSLKASQEAKSDFFKKILNKTKIPLFSCVWQITFRQSDKQRRNSFTENSGEDLLVGQFTH